MTMLKDSGKRVHFKSGMNRDTNVGKPRYDLVNEEMLTRWAILMMKGAEKYGERNWELANSPEEADRFKASAWRHFVSWSRGDIDEDHAAAVFFNIAAFERTVKKLLEGR